MLSRTYAESQAPAPAEPLLASSAFLSEVQTFQDAVADPFLTFDDKRHALSVIVQHAALLDPAEAGYPRVGVALKEALCSWLDFRLIPAH